MQETSGCSARELALNTKMFAACSTQIAKRVAHLLFPNGVYEIRTKHSEGFGSLCALDLQIAQVASSVGPQSTSHPSAVPV